jgi:hypothetical protein
VNEHLQTYLQDHLAGATGGLELAKRAAASNSGTALAEPLARIAAEIESDREELLDIADRLGVSRHLVKEGIAFVGEKASRLKLNDHVFEYSPLSRMLELEGLMLGVSGKLALWRALQNVVEHYPELSSAQLDTLVSRAESQRDRLEELRLTAARAALADDPAEGSASPRTSAAG